MNKTLNYFISAILFWIGLFGEMNTPFALTLIIKSFALLGALLVLNFDFTKRVFRKGEFVIVIYSLM